MIRDSLGLSFLDMLSCTLGGMILLFLIFSVMEHEGEARSAKRAIPALATIPSVPVNTRGPPAPYTPPALFRVTVRQIEEPSADCTGLTLTPLPMSTTLGVQALESEDARSTSFLVWVEDPAQPAALTLSKGNGGDEEAALRELGKVSLTVERLLPLEAAGLARYEERQALTPDSLRHEPTQGVLVKGS